MTIWRADVSDTHLEIERWEQVLKEIKGFVDTQCQCHDIGGVRLITQLDHQLKPQGDEVGHVYVTSDHHVYPHNAWFV